MYLENGKLHTVFSQYAHLNEIRVKKNQVVNKRDTIGTIGQDPIGHKVRQGDNRLPEGEYRIIQKSKGPFSGKWAEYYGPAWMRINYPNNYDAENGYQKGLITKKERKSIIKANNTGKFPPKTTKLGGGIGIHGWICDWIADGTQNLTWGCISMHNNDLLELYKKMPLNTKIIILP